ncbi:MAG: 1-(5-phosphoribosyl)-5-((5-phosphoribosylamino)methylideneamino) imidazole-4-carboxamide isomerase [Lentisphaerae bacterium ADurb.Bin242]|nr:MAG: 1-(5-phosphoribosyl)-5-((5-phosphoribosylamino)methylideneamino) imidazole-4-carboxamide isomerase [Lentisphaerae bacterium ADurb.Bin242]
MLIFPAIDMRNGRCVRLFQGDYHQETVYDATPAAQALVWQEAGAPLIHLVDLDGARAGHPVNIDSIRAICEKVTIPCEIGGGIRTEKDAEQMFSLGISRVILGTAACENPELVRSFLSRFGAERIVVGIDARDGMAALRGWLETSRVKAAELARDMAALGVKRIIFTDIATDGAFTGPSLGPTSELCRIVPECSIIASGGVSGADDAAKLAALKLPNLEGVIVGKALYDGRTTYQELAAAAGRP